MCRPKVAKLARCPRLRAVVEAKLELRWSPQQIAGWLSLEFPDDAEMRVSHETIYLSLFVQSRGALRKELTRYLRMKRSVRPTWRQAARNGQSHIPAMVQHPRTARRGRRPGRARPLGRRPDLRPRPRRRRHARRTPQPLRDARRPARDPPRRRRRRRARRQDHRAARTAPPLAHLGPRPRDGTATRSSPSPAACPSTSAIRAARGSAAPTRTPTGSCANTSRASPGSATAPKHELDAIAAELNGRPRQTLDWMTPSQALDRAMR